MFCLHPQDKVRLNVRSRYSDPLMDGQISTKHCSTIQEREGGLDNWVVAKGKYAENGYPQFDLIPHN